MGVFKINKEEVLRYLGYKGQDIDNSILQLVHECRKETNNLITPRYTYKIYDITQSEEELEIKNTSLMLKGKDIRKHLSSCSKCALMVVTLGVEIEKRIKLYERVSLTKALIMDACATTAVEEVCDMVQCEINKIAMKENKKLTFRFSPGYGDFPIDTQRIFLKVIEAEKEVGVLVSEYNILFPRKSVTAIVGFVPEDKELKERGCKECSNYQKCYFRKEGNYCGN